MLSVAEMQTKVINCSSAYKSCYYKLCTQKLSQLWRNFATFIRSFIIFHFANSKPSDSGFNFKLQLQTLTCKVNLQFSIWFKPGLSLAWLSPIFHLLGVSYLLALNINTTSSHCIRFSRFIILSFLYFIVFYSSHFSPSHP